MIDLTTLIVSVAKSVNEASDLLNTSDAKVELDEAELTIDLNIDIDTSTLDTNHKTLKKSSKKIPAITNLKGLQIKEITKFKPQKGSTSKPDNNNNISQERLSMRLVITPKYES